MADAGKDSNSAYDVSNATVKTHAVWCWLTTCLMRYPADLDDCFEHSFPRARSHIETYDFFRNPEPNEAEIESIRYLDEVPERGHRHVESVQRGMMTPAFSQGRIVNLKDRKIEHAGIIFMGWFWTDTQRGSHDTTQYRRFDGGSIAPHFTGPMVIRLRKPPY